MRKFKLSQSRRHFHSIIYFVCYRSPVTHKMAPWVSKVFMKILPKILCIERPPKEEHPEDEATEVLTDVFHVPSDIDKFTDYGSKRFSQDYDIAGEYLFSSSVAISVCVMLMINRQ